MAAVTFWLQNVSFSGVFWPQYILSLFRVLYMFHVSLLALIKTWITNYSLSLPRCCCGHQVTSSWVREGRCWNGTVKWRQSAWSAWWETRWNPLSHSTTAWSPGRSTAMSAWRICWAAWGDPSSWTARWESGRFESYFPSFIPEVISHTNIIEFCVSK